MTEHQRSERFSMPPRGSSIYAEVNSGRIFVYTGVRGAALLSYDAGRSRYVLVIQRFSYRWLGRKCRRYLDPDRRFFLTFNRAMSHLNKSLRSSS